MAIDKRIQNMIDGDRDAIIGGFTSSTYVLRVNASIQSVLHQMKDKKTESKLWYLKNDDTYVFARNAGFRVSDFACAALHLLGFAQYEGADRAVIALINSKFKIS